MQIRIDITFNHDINIKMLIAKDFYFMLPSYQWDGEMYSNLFAE